MEILISFCITVYNQSDLVKECLDSIVPYRGEDIEIVISDDGSSEDIRGLVDGYRDNRIKYYVNEKNLGHDRNILNALSKATGKYAFLLRTRDRMIPGSIPLLIQAAKAGCASYITGDAVNQNGILKIQYQKESFGRGNEALEAHFKLFIHPSGNMYRLADINSQDLFDFLDERRVPKNGFIVHNLIRLALTATGDFRFIQVPVWIYTDTESAGDRAVNRSSGGIGIYDPSLSEMRYRYEVAWAKSILEGDTYLKAYYALTSLYLEQVTWNFKLLNNDKRAQYHYDYEKIRFSVSEERRKFRDICESLYDEKTGTSRKSYERVMDGIFLKNRFGFVKFVVRSATLGTPLYHLLARMYKRYVKRL